MKPMITQQLPITLYTIEDLTRRRRQIVQSALKELCRDRRPEEWYHDHLHPLGVVSWTGKSLIRMVGEYTETPLYRLGITYTLGQEGIFFDEEDEGMRQWLRPFYHRTVKIINSYQALQRQLSAPPGEHPHYDPLKLAADNLACSIINHARFIVSERVEDEE
ncbi:MAG TPA: hypothetical protein VJB87_01810 [Candidatus Nanoarchaeia archaeon]|nr:hypothetical protein [Candidatus Nanoarchaeia archaeon]